MNASGSYAYRAARRDGAIALGMVEASSRDEASAIVSCRGLFPIEVRLQQQAGPGRRRIRVADLALGLRLLATLLESGLPMARALQALDDLAPASWLPFLPELRQGIREGSGLGAALSASPIGLPAVVIGIIKAGEAGGALAPAVGRAAELMEQTTATRAAIRAALAYPMVLATAGTLSLALLVGVVVPRFGAILSDLGQALPPLTSLVLDATELFRAAWLPGLLSGIAITIGCRAWIGTEVGSLHWHRLLLRVPGLAPFRASAATARIAAAWSSLLDSGVPLASALRHAAHAGGDAAVAQRLLAARESIINGSGIARALESEHALTPTAIRLVRAGEETGRLATMLAQASRLEHDRAARQVMVFARLIEPVLILAFGAVVALVAASLLQAVYSVRPLP